MDIENVQQNEQANNPLHGVKLATMLDDLVEEYGWEELYTMVNINCFKSNPSIKSSLNFLRKTQWARDRIEGIYLKLLRNRKKDSSQKNKPLKTEEKVKEEEKAPLKNYGSKPSYLD